MDLSGVSLEDMAPLMHDLEVALADEQVQRVVFRDDEADCYYADLSRAQAQRLLTDLETHFFARAN